MEERSFSIGKFKISFVNAILLAIYVCVFVYLINVPAIYSPATNSYWHVNINRYPVYIFFIRGMDLVFGQTYYDISIVTFQLLFSLLGIHYFFKKIYPLLKPYMIAQVVLLAVLIFPLFPPLNTANNICPEGLTYPMYLFFISYIMDFLFKENYKTFYLLLLSYIVLILTRGQFSIMIPTIILIFVLKYRKMVFKKPYRKYLLLLIITPFMANTLDSTYRKIVHDQFITTPFSYSNAITLPLFISEKQDSLLFKDKNHRAIFVMSYDRMDSLDLLSSRVDGTYLDKYLRFHNNFPKICNQNFYDQGWNHYCNIHGDIFRSKVDIELAARQMMPLLIKQHFKEWVLLLWTNMIYGFKSLFVFLFFLAVFIYSGIAVLKKYTTENGILLFCSTLILINAVLVAIAVHTIIRYQFYFFPLALIIVFLLIKKSIRYYASRT